MLNAVWLPSDRARASHLPWSPFARDMYVVCTMFLNRLT